MIYNLDIQKLIKIKLYEIESDRIGFCSPIIQNQIEP